MFKNPLKYQNGGAAPSQEEQQILAAFIEWLPKRVKEFEGMQPNEIAQALDGMSKTSEGKNNYNKVQGGSQAFRQGGKIHDFICKHGKGGKAGCGCKKDSGGLLETPESPESAKKLTPSLKTNPSKIIVKKPESQPTYNRFEQNPTRKKSTQLESSIKPKDSTPQQSSKSFEDGGGLSKKKKSLRDILANATINAAMAENPAVMTASGWRQDNNGNMIQDAMYDPGVSKLRDNISVISTLSPTHPMNAVLRGGIGVSGNWNPVVMEVTDFPIYGAKLGLEQPVMLQYKNGGEIRKYAPGGWLSRMYNRFVGRRAPDTLEATNRRVRTWTDDNGVQHIIEDANVNGNSTITTIDINGDDTLGRQKITTGDDRYRMVNLQPGTPAWRTVMSRNVSKEATGGRVKKKFKDTRTSTMDDRPKDWVLEDTDVHPFNQKIVEYDPYTDLPTGNFACVGEPVLPYVPELGKYYNSLNYLYDGNTRQIIGERSIPKEDSTIRNIWYKCGGKVEKAQDGYSIDYPGHETIVSPPTRMQLSITPSANKEKKDSSFVYQLDPDHTIKYASVVYDKNGEPYYGLHTSDKRNGRRISENEFSGYRNKWESLKEFFIDNPEFNQRRSYTPFIAPITLNK